MNRTVNNIQFLRFIAAIMVVFYHSLGHLESIGYHSFLFSMFKPIGYAGVDIFFVISGFVIAYSTQHIHTANQTNGFLLKRFARIYLGYWPFLLLYLWLYSVINPDIIELFHPEKIVLLLPTATGKAALPIAWTLTYELYFYLCFALCLWIRQYFKQIVPVAATIYSLVILFVALQIQPKTESALYFFTSPYILEFFAGIWLFHIARQEQHAKPSPIVFLACSLTLFCIAASLDTFVFQYKLVLGNFVLLRVLLFGVASFLLVRALISLEHYGFFCTNKFLLLFGNASYAIYLSHNFFLLLIYSMGLRSLVEGHLFLPLIVYLLNIGIIIFVSSIYYLWIEKPLNQSAKSLIDNRHLLLDRKNYRRLYTSFSLSLE